MIEATRSFDRKRISEKELKTAFENDAKAIVALQKKNNFAFISDGMLKWNDLFRPFAENVDGISVGAITRFFETNTFYKKPVISKKIDSKCDFLEKYFFFELFPKNSQLTATLPAPYTFAELCENNAYSSKEELMFAIARMLNNAAKFLEKKGFSLIQFSDPALVYNATFKKIPKEEIAKAKDALGIASRGLKCKTMLHTFFGDFSKICPEILNAEVDMFGIDFCETELENLNGNSFLRRLALGIVDSKNSIVENATELEKKAKEIAKVLDLNDFAVCPNFGLDFVPYKIAEKKIASLGTVGKKLKVKI